MNLTPRENQCLTFIVAKILETGRSPFQIEIAAHFGTKSRGFVWRLVRSLETKGAIRIRMFEKRGIEVVGLGCGDDPRLAARDRNRSRIKGIAGEARS